MYRAKIGIMGGYGAYAGLHFYERVLEEFKTGCERDYPHIIMDNDFTMPSRTRALLYGEAYEEVVFDIASSAKRLIGAGADYIIMCCGTAHAFLPDVYRTCPELKKRIIHIIEATADYINQSCNNDVLVIAAEGALKHRIYETILNNHGIRTISPSEEQYTNIRRFIESVKQNNITDEILEEYNSFLSDFETKNVLLGCTEFPILTKKWKENTFSSDYVFFDPLESVISVLKKILL